MSKVGEGGDSWKGMGKGEGLSEVHVRRARFINALLVVMTVVFVISMSLQLTHWPRVLLEDHGVQGEWEGNVTAEWDSITITPDIDLRTQESLAWEVTRDSEEEVVAEGSMGSLGEDLIQVEDIGPGEYRISLEPRERGGASTYSVTVHEHYLRPSATHMADMAALAVLALFNFALAVYLYPRYHKHKREYRLTLWVTAPALFVVAMLEMFVVSWP